MNGCFSAKFIYSTVMVLIFDLEIQLQKYFVHDGWRYSDCGYSIVELLRYYSSVRIPIEYRRCYSD